MNAVRQHLGYRCTPASSSVHLSREKSAGMSLHEGPLAWRGRVGLARFGRLTPVHLTTSCCRKCLGRGGMRHYQIEARGRKPPSSGGNIAWKRSSQGCYRAALACWFTASGRVWDLNPLVLPWSVSDHPVIIRFLNQFIRRTARANCTSNCCLIQIQNIVRNLPRSDGSLQGKPASQHANESRISFDRKHFQGRKSPRAGKDNRRRNQCGGDNNIRPRVQRPLA